MSRVIIQSLPDYTHAQLLTSDGRSLIADEPSSDDGNDLGPTPYELLMWALGACTSMTIQMYARRKGYPLEEVAIEVDHKRTHLEDCEECVQDGETGRIEVLSRKIVLRGPLTDAQRDDLLRVAQKCPVHKTIQSNPRIIDTVEVV